MPRTPRISISLAWISTWSKALASSIRETVKILWVCNTGNMSAPDAYFTLQHDGPDFAVAEAGGHESCGMSQHGRLPKAYFAKKTPYWRR